MAETTDQDEARMVGDRLAPPTTPDKNAIREDRRDVHAAHDADRMPTPEEEQAAERGAGHLDEDAKESYEEMLERGAAQEGEGKPGL